MNSNDAALICRALGDTNRLQIVELLTHGEQCTCVLLEHFRITQPTLTHHMIVLSECGILKSRKEGRKTLYSLDCKKMSEFREFISRIKCGE